MMSAFTSSKTFEEKTNKIFEFKSDPCIRLDKSFCYEIKRFCSVKDLEDETEINLSFRTTKYEKAMNSFNSKFSINTSCKEFLRKTKSHKSM